ncbi:MAG: PAS domain S-box protein [Stygiobacter sp.]
MNNNIKILILEDKQSDYELICAELNRGKLNYEINWVQDEGSYVNALESYQPDLIISDYRLPSFDGIKAIKKAKEINPIIPVIIVTGSINEDTAVECIKAGACDYVIKEHFKRLVPAIVHALKEKDLTMQKLEAEIKLKQSEQTYRFIFENNPHPMWVYDVETLKFLAVNNTAINKYGYTREEFLELTLKDIRPSEDIPLLLENVKEDKDEFSYSGVWRHKSKSGEIFLVEIFSNKIIFNKKNARLVLANDVTERKKAEEKLINQLKIFDEVQDAIIVTDENFNITFWNKAAEKIYSYKSEEAIGKNEIKLLQSEFIEFEGLDFITELKKKKVLKTKLLQKTKDGKTIYIDSIYNLFYDITGQINGYVTVNRDVTKEKQIEFNLKSAKEKAEDASRLKTYFLNNISHELRTPLVPIITASELLLEELNNEDHKKLVSSILLGGRRLNSTISKILELTDIEALEGKIILNELNLVSILKNVTEKYKELALAKGLDFKIEFDSDEIISISEKNYLIKTVNHLVDNAVNFTEKGFVLIKINKLSDEWNRIVVQDTGIGIPIEKQKIIFDPFRQSSEGYGRKYEGTGLGLALVKKYVDLLKCKITLESIPNIGTTIEIRIPAKILDQPKNDFNIMFVDDDLESLNIYRRILKENYSYDLISSVNEAKAIAAVKNYDIIFLDINLSSELTGFELLEYFKNYPNLKNTFFVSLTAYSSNIDTEKFIRAGFDKVLIKPFKKNELIDIIDNRIKEISY